MAGVFISYRQADSKAWAAFLRDELVDVFAPEQIFLDRDTLHAGSWREQIQAAVTQCNVTLVVIGRAWLDDTNRQRLAQPDDVHRNEIAAALARKDMRVIPVLVDDAPMPRPEHLPPDLHPLLECQARRFSDNAAYRAVDVQALAADIEGAGGIQRRTGAAPAPEAARAAPVAVEQKHFVPFKLTEAQAREAFAKWTAGLALAPKDVAQASRVTALAPAWVPFWLGSITVSAPWTGKRGHTRTEMQTVAGADGKPTQRSVKVEEFTAVAGEFNRRFEDVVVSAGVALPGDLPPLLTEASARRVHSASTLPDAAVPVRPATVPLERAEVELRRLVHEKAETQVRSDIGGEKPAITQLDARYDRTELRMVHQPVYLGSYAYGGKNFEFTVNADTGDVDGASPLSGGKVGLIVAGVLAVVALVAFWFFKH